MTNYREYQRVIKLSAPQKQQLATPPSSSSESSPKSMNATLAQNIMSLNSNANNVIPKKKITRTKTGCFCCRRRKKKCDEMKPACSGCVRNMLSCVYPSADEIKKPERKPTSSRKKRALAKVLELHNQEHQQLDHRHDNCCESPVLTPNHSSPSSPQSVCSGNGSHYVSPLSSPNLQPLSYDTTSTTTKSSEDLDVPRMSEGLFTSNYSNLRVPKYPKAISIKSLLN